MQQIKRFLFGLFLCMVFLPCVSAKCTTEERAELNTMAASIKADYEEAQRVRDKDEYSVPDAVLGTEEEETYVSYEDYFKININNVTDKVRVEVTNNYDSSRLAFNSKDATDGIVTFDWKNLDKVTTFTIKVYADGDRKCTSDTLRTLYLTTPRFNEYYDYDLCAGAKELDVCQKYVTFKNVDFYSFVDKVEKYLKENEKTSEEVIKNKKQRRIVIISVVLLVAVSGVVATAIVMKKRSSEV